MTDLIERLREAASLFREHPVYNSEGDGVRLTLNADLDDEAADEIARLLEALEKIAEYKPSFDYVGADDHGINPDIPGSPYDRGKEDAAKHLSGIARAALKEADQ